MPTPPTDAMRRVAEEYSDLPGRSRVSDAHLAGQVKGRADAAEYHRAQARRLEDSVAAAYRSGCLDVYSIHDRIRWHRSAADAITRGDWETDE